MSKDRCSKKKELPDLLREAVKDSRKAWRKRYVVRCGEEAKVVSKLARGHVVLAEVGRAVHREFIFVDGKYTNLKNRR